MVFYFNTYDTHNLGRTEIFPLLFFGDVNDIFFYLTQQFNHYLISYKFYFELNRNSEKIDVVFGSDIKPCNKIDKPQVVYRFW